MRRTLALVALVLAIQAGPLGASASSTAAAPVGAAPRAAGAPVTGTLPRAAVGRGATVGQAAAKACPAGLVALTFDDGPARHVTRDLVKILLDRHVPATFFMVGGRVSSAPGVALMVARAGFTIGNHTWSHPQLTRLSDSAVRHEIRTTARELRHVGIPPSTLMRPPYGAINPRVRADVRDLGLVPVLWNVDSEDWRGGSSRQIADSILRQLQRHRDNIVLQHDGVRNSPASVAAVPRVIHQARERGFCFGSLGPHGHVLLPTVDAVPDPAPALRTTPDRRSVPARPAVDSPFSVVLGRAGAAT